MVDSVYSSSTPQLSAAPEKSQFDVLLQETRDVLASADFSYVLDKCLDRATGVLCSGIEASVFSQNDGNTGSEERVRLAALMPDLAHWSQTILRGVPNELVDVRFFTH